MYHVRYEFDAGGEPPHVFITDEKGTCLIEVLEEPVLEAGEWSRDEDDWSPGPLARRVLGLLNGETP